MREMDGHARRVVEHAAGVVDAEAAPQHEGILVVGLRESTGPGTSEDPGRPAPRSCCWSSRRGTPAAPAPPGPGRPTAARARRRSTSAIAREHAGAVHRARAAARIDSHSHSSKAKVVSPPSRWPVTISGLSSQVTVSMPSMPWNTTSASSSSAKRHAHAGLAARADRQRGDDHDDQAERAPRRSDGSSRPRPCAHRRSRRRSARRSPVGAT